MAPGGWDDPEVRQKLMAVLSEERIRNWTNQRIRAGHQGRAARRDPESSVGKVHQGDLNQRIQLLATDLLGADAIAWSVGSGPGAGANGAVDAGSAMPSRCPTR